MPFFDFESRKTGKIVSIYLNVDEPAESYHQQVIDNETYYRVYYAPYAAKDTKTGDLTEKDFERVTTDKKGLTVGKMQEISKEMHVSRKERDGIDKAKEKFYKDYEKNTGHKHTDITTKERVAKAQKSLKKFGVNVEL